MIAMRYRVALFLAIVCLVLWNPLAPGTSKPKPSTATATSAPDVPPLTVDDLAGALGMETFCVRSPPAAADGSPPMLGFTYATADGIAGCAYGSVPPDTVVRVIYWIDGKRIRFSIRNPTGSISGSLPAADLLQRRGGSSAPDRARIYDVGSIVAKWSLRMGAAMTHDQRVGPDEIGFLVVDMATKRTVLPPRKPAAVTPEPQAPIRQPVEQPGNF